MQMDFPLILFIYPTSSGAIFIECRSILNVYLLGVVLEKLGLLTVTDSPYCKLILVFAYGVIALLVCDVCFMIIPLSK